MTGAEVFAILGAGGTLVAIIVALVGLSRSTTEKINAGDQTLHDRINRVRDEYVRRVDLDSHLSRVDDAIIDLRDESREGTREINRRLDAILTALPSPAKTVRR